MSEIFNDKNRAFYKLAASYPMGKISTKDYLPWVRGLFAKKGVALKPDIIKTVINRCENHPMYVQQFLYFLWDEDDFSVETLNQVEIKILQKSFIATWQRI